MLSREKNNQQSTYKSQQGQAWQDVSIIEVGARSLATFFLRNICLHYLPVVKLNWITYFLVVAFMRFV